MPSALSTRLRRALPRPRLTRRRLVTGAIVLAVLLGVTGWAAWPTPASYVIENRMITVATGPDGSTKVDLDTTYYKPKAASKDHPVAAVLLAHGFGGTKADVADDAKSLADHGYAVLAWTAEGFGASGGQIHLDSPDWEVRDAQRLIDWLASRPEIRTDAPGDPKVAVVGASYGGGLALMSAAYDRRIDAIVPQITWNDLSNAFLPESTGAGAASGVFKKVWAGLFFGSGASAGASLTGVGGAAPTGGAPTDGAPDSGAPSSNGAPDSGTPPRGGRRASGDPSCGRFATDVCRAYLTIAETGSAGPEQLALLRKSSPASVLDRITAPTLLIQGQADSLFPLSEADANAKGIAAHGTPVRVAWFTGGHDGGAGPQSDQDRLHFLTAQWLDHYLLGKDSAPANSFTYSRIAGIDANADGVVALGSVVTDYPGVSGAHTSAVSVQGRPQPIANPPNGNPAAVTSLPGLGGALASFVSGRVIEIPGQHADFLSAPLPSTVDVVGAPTVQIKAASPTGQAVLFVKLYDVDPQNGATLPDGLVAPVRLTGLPTSIDQARPVTVTLPAIVHEFQAGHLLRISIASADQAYLTPASPTVYTVGLGDSAVTLPTVDSKPIATAAVLWRGVLVGLLVLLAIGIALGVLLGRRRYRRADRSVLAEYAGVPLVVNGLRKAYDDGFVAVSTVDFRVERGQVVGLLGPNGAGKTTSLRVLMGLIKPTAGDIYVFGHRLTPGSPVLSRLGALVEGPGFLPHLSGLRNLRLFWRSTGRPEAEARLDEALDIAGLGEAIHRKVKTYSHGMKQRLAIAQAMLGLPELLVLDEPTDGLDPPQIAEMRRVLRRYATDGRAVLVSSHLLAEVEQTCTHVVVLHKGEVVAAGPVDDIVGDSPSVQFDVSDPAAATVALQAAGVRSVTGEGNGSLTVDLDGTARADAVAALVHAGVGVDRVVPRRRLEDAFLALVAGDTKASGER